MTLADRQALWGAVLLLVTPCAIGLHAVIAPASGVVVPRQEGGPVRREVSRRAVAVESLAVTARRVAPFRADGRPSAVAYDPVRSEAVPEYLPPKPSLALKGILEGGASLAIIEGIPGRDGPVLLGVGDTVAGLRVRRIRDGQVTVTGMDTTWQLRIREQ